MMRKTSLSQGIYAISDNPPVQIVSVSATSMTWLTIDPQLLDNGIGDKYYLAFQTTFTKQ